MSMDSAHSKPASATPGPWEVDPEIHSSDYGALQEDGSRTLLRQYVRHAGRRGGRIGACFQNCLVTSDAELIANAHLFAAAPTLLTAAMQASFALRDLLPNDHDAQMTVGMLEAAIKKAKP